MIKLPKSFCDFTAAAGILRLCSSHVVVCNRSLSFLCLEVAPSNLLGGRNSIKESVGERREPGGIFKCRSAERICWRADERSRNFSAELGRGFGAWLGAKVRLPRPTNCANAPWWFSSLFLLCEEEFLLKKRKVVVVPGTKSKGETRTGRHFQMPVG